MPRPASPLPSHRVSVRRRTAALAFTLPELLLYTSLSGFLLLVATATLLTSLRSNRNMELRQRAEERWNRISALIQSEASEAQRVEVAGSIATSCSLSDPPVSGSGFLRLQIPYLDSSQTRQCVYVHYFNSGSGANAQLQRSGPPFAATGALAVNSPATVSTLGLRTELLNLLAPAPNDVLTYRLNFYTPEGNLILARDGRAAVGVEPASVCNAAQTTCNP